MKAGGRATNATIKFAGHCWHVTLTFQDGTAMVPRERFPTAAHALDWLRTHQPHVPFQQCGGKAKLDFASQSHTHIDITLYRGRQRAVFAPRGRQLSDLPAEVRDWLGDVERVHDSSITEETPMLGLSAINVIADIAAHGYCAIDIPVIAHAYPDKQSRLGR